MIFNFVQERYNINELDAHSDFKKLTSEQQGQCKALYKEVCPYVIMSVIETFIFYPLLLLFSKNRLKKEY